MSRQALHKALSADGNPEFSTIIKVAGALGLRMAIERRKTSTVKGDAASTKDAA
jgi:DNA-binding phage protein